MIIATINDIHFGARNNSLVFLENQKTFLDEVFFPTLKADNIKNLLILGDIFDNRKTIDLNVLYSAKRYFFDVLFDMGVQVFILLGNHDIYYKNSLFVNSPELLLKEYSNIKLIDEPIEDWGMLMVPWIVADNRDKIFDKIQNTKMRILAGHFEINGFSMENNAKVCTSGIHPSMFEGFDIVISGHFHNKSSKGNVHYLGAPSQFTWNDVDCARGFHIFDTDKLDLRFIENPFNMFVRIVYDFSFDQNGFDFSLVKDKFVELVINADHGNKAEFIQKIEDHEPFSFEIIDNENISYLDEGFEIETLKNEDTTTLIKDYVSMMVNSGKDDIERLFLDVYMEALQLDDKI